MNEAPYTYYDQDRGKAIRINGEFKYWNGYAGGLKTAVFKVGERFRRIPEMDLTRETLDRIPEPSGGRRHGGWVDLPDEGWKRTDIAWEPPTNNTPAPPAPTQDAEDIELTHEQEREIRWMAAEAKAQRAWERENAPTQDAQVIADQQARIAELERENNTLRVHAESDGETFAEYRERIAELEAALNHERFHNSEFIDRNAELVHEVERLEAENGRLEVRLGSADRSIELRRKYERELQRRVVIWQECAENFSKRLDRASAERDALREAVKNAHWLIGERLDGTLLDSDRQTLDNIHHDLQAALGAESEDGA